MAPVVKSIFMDNDRPGNAIGVQPRNPGQAVHEYVLLELQLLFVRNVEVRASAAPVVQGAGRYDPVSGSRNDVFYLAGAVVFFFRKYPDRHGFTGDRIGDKNGFPFMTAEKQATENRLFNFNLQDPGLAGHTHPVWYIVTQVMPRLKGLHF